MIIELYSINDQATQEFTPPFAVASEKAALRVFEEILETDTIKRKHKEDFNLYFMGEMNTDTGIIIQNKDPELIKKGEDYGG